MSIDLANYANIASIAENDLISVNSIRQQMAELNAQSKDQKLASTLGIKTSIGEGLGELSTEALAGGIIKLVNTYGGSAAKSLLQSAGVDEDTANALLSGDLEGAGTSFAKTLVSRITGTDTEIPTSVDELTSAVGEQFSGFVNGAGSQPSGFLSRMVDSFNRQTPVEDSEGIEMQVFNEAPSQDEVLASALASPRPPITNDLIPEGAGNVIESGEATQATVSTLGDTASGLVDTAGDVASAVAGGATDALTGVAEAGIDVAVTAGAEAVGAGLDATGILAPLGFLVGIFGAIFGGVSEAEEARKHANDVANAMASATLSQGQVLNPATQFL
jgi:hypothetical protein